MLQKDYKWVYTNYQFYEHAAWTAYIQKQMQQGYAVCGIYGVFGHLLKFRRTDHPKSCMIYRKHYAGQIDDEIGRLRNSSRNLIYENQLYAVMEADSDAKEQMYAADMEQKQNAMFLLPLKKSIFAVLFFSCLRLQGWESADTGPKPEIHLIRCVLSCMLR